MTEVKQGHVYTDNLRVLEKIMGVMFNNVKFSDTVFTVKEQKFYALSQLLAASSTTLDSMITEHYEHCDDKDITLHNVKHGDSFMIILKYMYGLRIDFSEINIPVLCEVLSLSNAYQLVDFSKDLKDYLSKLDHYQLESAVVLLNTANKYDIPELYDHVTTFAYENSDELVKHESFQDLGYNVLTDLLKSDWFCCSEIDILKGVLTWHSDMDKERTKVKETLEKKNVGDDTVDRDESSVNEIQPDNCEKDLSEEVDLESVDGDECLKVEKSNINEKDECSSANANRDSEQTNKEKTEKCLKTAKSFSENILKSLLALIRISQMSCKDLLEALMTEVLFKNYSHLLADVESFSQSCESRKTYLAITQVSIEGQHGVLQNITQVFIIEEVNYPDTKYDSTESYLFEDLTCKISVQVTPWSTEKNQKHEIRVFTSYLTFCSVEDKDWECTTECQLKLISKQPNLHKDLVLPEDNSYTTLTLSSENPCVQIGKWDWEGNFDDWYSAYKPAETQRYTLTLDFKSIHRKI
uniref:BTB/POZ domain-containing protein 9 n=1 Tax=Cacopsylla melanoneura TaxID=428564 RepID=A0A8D8UBW7_9HEMI